jgi:cysteine desulfurase/selenocysteine lyase
MKTFDELRSETPGAQRTAHFNSCGAALPPTTVVEAQIGHLKLEASIGGYEAAATSTKKNSIYASAAQLIGCSEAEIAFTDSASRAWNVFVYSLSLRPGDEILTSRIEFGTNLISLQHVAERSGAKLRILDPMPDGTVDVSDLSRRLSERTKLVAITHAAAHFGGVNPVEEIGALLAGFNALYLVDACQSVGQMQVDVSRIRCHALTATGRKWLRGPRGSGFLYVREGVSEAIDPVLSDLVTADLLLDQHDNITGITFGPDARRFELWERNVAGEIGLGVAIQYLLSVGLDFAHKRIKQLSDLVKERLSDVPHITVIEASGGDSGLIGVVSAERSLNDVKRYLADHGVSVSTMADYHAPLDFAARGLESVLRIAPHYYNTEADVDKLHQALYAAMA